MLHLIDVWLLDICNTLGGCLAQLILQRLLGAFQVVLLQEGKDGLQVQGLFYYLFHFIFLPRLKLPPKIYFLIIPPNLLAFRERCKIKKLKKKN